MGMWVAPCLQNDDYKKNVEMARKNGIQGIFFEDGYKLKNDLKEINII